MLTPYLWTLHALTLRQLADASQIADIVGLAETEVEAALETGADEGTVMTARTGAMVTPAGRALLDDAYAEAFAAQRADPALLEGFQRFEDGVNKQVLELMTAWQTREVDGTPVPNDHSDPDYDAEIIAKLGKLHEKVTRVLEPVIAADPLMERFLDRLEQALVRAEGGETEFVSGVRVDSYHTLWFQMHEHLLRLMGKERAE